MNRNYLRVLTIAGSDSSGGAGIQADLKTFSALGCYGMSVITAITAQNTVAVTAIHEIPTDIIAKQLDAVLDDVGVDAVKIGMLSSPAVIQTIARILRSRDVSNIVLDPVMVSKSGAKLLPEDALNSLILDLLPLAKLVTPNIPEAELLAGQRIENQSDMETAGAKILSFGSQAVLVKGGHRQDDICTDCLCRKNESGQIVVDWFESKRIDTPNTHGTGCTLSSAIAAHLAKGYGLQEAVKSAKHYLDSAILAGSEYSLGHGHGPVHHFHELWKE